MKKKQFNPLTKTRRLSKTHVHQKQKQKQHSNQIYTKKSYFDKPSLIGVILQVLQRDYKRDGERESGREEGNLL